MILMDTPAIAFATLAAKAEAGQWNLVTLGSEAAIHSFRSRLHAAHQKMFSTRLDPVSGGERPLRA